MGSGERWRSPITGYVCAVAIPVATTLLVSALGWPSFVFEHLIILLVVAVAIPWGLGAAIVAAVIGVVADNLMLHEPIGRPVISGSQDVIDLVLFAIVAIVVSGLVARARAERIRAEQAASRERLAREDRDRLIATVSHDLATPLSVLAGTVQLARRHGSRAESDLPRLLARLETATARATSLVRTLADARAIDSEALALSLEPLDLRSLVTPIVEMLDRLSDRHPLRLIMPDMPVMVRGDAERLERVIENLVNNAIKYSPDGGEVEISVTIDGDQALVRVRDYGIGIEAEALPHVFERSYRAPRAAATAPGLGLGLSIAAAIVDRHGGRMWADSAEPRGTVVALCLPLAEEAHATAAAVTSAAQTSNV
jgi:signal transduction histidine kinase